MYIKKSVKLGLNFALIVCQKILRKQRIFNERLNIFVKNRTLSESSNISRNKKIKISVSLFPFLSFPFSLAKQKFGNAFNELGSDIQMKQKNRQTNSDYCFMLKLYAYL